jgi:hypothetical protein
VNPQGYTNLIFDEGMKKHDGEKIVSSTNVSEKTGYLPAEN